MKMHICVRCRGVLYGYPEMTRYCYACKAATMIPVNIADYDFDYSGNASNAYPAGPVFDEYVENSGTKSFRPSKKKSRHPSSGQRAKNRRKPITLGMGVRAFLSGRSLIK